MGSIVYSPNTYAGEAYRDAIWPSIVPAHGLIDRGIVTPLPGIKKRTVLRNIDWTVEFQDPSCLFVDGANNIASGEKYIDPVKYEVMEQICFADVRTSWDAMKLKKGSLNDYVPPADLEAALLEYMSAKIAIMNEQLYIFGKAGVTEGLVTFSAAYPGEIARLIADSTVNKFNTAALGNTMALSAISIANPGVVTVVSTANLKTGDKVTITGANAATLVGGVTINGQSFVITVLSSTTFSLGKQTTGTATSAPGVVSFTNSSNIIATLTFVYNNIPEKIRNKGDIKILVPDSMARAYALSQGANATQGGSFYVGEKSLDFLGAKIEPMYYWPSDTIVVWSASNVFLGFDDEGDETNIRVTDMSKSTGDDVFRYKASMKTDINHLYGNEILLISPLVP